MKRNGMWHCYHNRDLNTITCLAVEQLQHMAQNQLGTSPWWSPWGIGPVGRCALVCVLTSFGAPANTSESQLTAPSLGNPKARFAWTLETQVSFVALKVAL
jgi:hypothetical protein